MNQITSSLKITSITHKATMPIDTLAHIQRKLEQLRRNHQTPEGRITMTGAVTTAYIQIILEPTSDDPMGEKRAAGILDLLLSPISSKW